MVRKERGFTLRGFAAELGVSPSAVSQIESGKIRPTMKRLHDIVRILGIGLEEVFEAPTGAQTGRLEPHEQAAAEGSPSGGRPDGVHFAAEADHARLRLEDGIEWIQIAPARLPQMEILRTVYPPGARAAQSTEFVQHSGWEMGYVLEGRMRIQVAFSTQDVGAGESICFDSSVPHKISNPFAQPAVAVWIRSTRPLG